MLLNGLPILEGTVFVTECICHAAFWFGSWFLELSASIWSLEVYNWPSPVSTSPAGDPPELQLGVLLEKMGPLAVALSLQCLNPDLSRLHTIFPPGILQFRAFPALFRI